MKILLFISLIIFFFSCNNITIKHISQLNNFENNAFVYSLPKTVLNVHLKLEKQIVKKGPYAEYAYKLLGIENVPTKDYEKYTIKDIYINESIQADTSQIFAILYKHHLPFSSIIQQNDGIILAINKNSINQNLLTKKQENKFINNTYSFDQIAFIELTNSDFVQEHIDTIFKEILVDSNWVRIAIQRKKSDTLSIQDKAQEAAHHIMDLRMRLFDLLTGEIEIMPNGEAAKTIVEQLKKEEKEYLSLFIGKTYNVTTNYYFTIIPENISKTQYLLGYLDSYKGIINKPTQKSKPIILQIKPFDSFNPFTQAQFKYQKAKKKNAFSYRLPIPVSIGVKLDNVIIYQNQSFIYQWGKIMEIPVCLLKKYSFDFNNLQYTIIERL